MKKNIFILILFTFLFQSCGYVKDYIPISVDKTIGAAFAEQAKINPIQENILDTLKYKKAYLFVESIKSNLLQSKDIKYRKDFEWKLHIVQNDSILNAYCVAGGYIYIYTGLIKFLDNEAQLAGVMAHEIAHADLRHTTLRMVSEYGITAIISLAMGGDLSFLIQIGRELLGLSFSRTDEANADAAAVKYMTATKYDPRAVGGFFKKLLEKDKDNNMLEFLSTHPSSENRVQDIEKEWKKLGAKQGKLFQKEYQDFKSQLP